MPSHICGQEIKQMTLYDYFFLNGLESPFLKNESFLPADIGIFLWVLSKDYKPCTKAREAFCDKIKDIKIAKAEEEIMAYIEMTFADMDTGEQEKQKQYAPFLAYQIDLFAKEYGWRIDEILKLPLRQLFQLNTAIAERYTKQNGKTYTKLRAVDMIEAEALLKQAKQEAEQNKVRNN